MPMQYIENFFSSKKFYKIFLIFSYFCSNIDCGYTLEPPRRGGINVYTQSMFWSKNKKNRHIPATPIFFYIKVGFNGVHISQTCFPDVSTVASNFVIDDRRRVRLIDFGSSRLPYDIANVIRGWTPEYLAPECCKYLLAKWAKRSEPGPIHPITTKVDVFAFAMVIYFLMTGKHLLVGLVTPDCEYAPGQRSTLRNSLVQQVSL